MNITGGIDGATQGLQNASAGLDEMAQTVENAIGGALQVTAVTLVIVAVIAFVGFIIRAVLVGALARSKGYSFFGNFVLGLFFGIFALIYEAGRPVSYERECVMQDRLSIQTSKELFKLQRAREKMRMTPAGAPQKKDHE